MTQEHPIIPPLKLREQWLQSPHDALVQAAQWGADQQLEQDARWLDTCALFSAHLTITPSGDALRQAMRPKSLSLKEQALTALDDAILRGDCITTSDALPAIRRALEQLDD